MGLFNGDKEKENSDILLPEGDYEEFFGSDAITEDEFQITVYKHPDIKHRNQKLEWIDTYDHIPDRKELGLRVGGAKCKFIGKNLKTGIVKTTTYNFHESWNLKKLQNDQELYQKYGPMGFTGLPTQPIIQKDDSMDKAMEIVKIVLDRIPNQDPSELVNSILKKTVASNIDLVNEVTKDRLKDFRRKEPSESMSPKDELLLAAGDKLLDKLDKFGDKILNGGQMTKRLAEKKIKEDPLYDQIKDNQEILKDIFEVVEEKRGRKEALELFESVKITAVFEDDQKEETKEEVTKEEAKVNG